jgi:galactokinase
MPGDQGLSIALALSDSILRGVGAWRVHGGGFAGTIMAFVPDDLHKTYKDTLESVFGENSCITLSIRNFGGTEVTPELSAQ